MLLLTILGILIAGAGATVIVVKKKNEAKAQSLADSLAVIPVTTTEVSTDVSTEVVEAPAEESTAVEAPFDLEQYDVVAKAAVEEVDLEFVDRVEIDVAPSLIKQFKKPHVVEIYQDKRGDWRWRLFANGRNMANGSEGYATKSAVLKALKFMSVRFAVAKTIKKKVGQ